MDDVTNERFRRIEERLMAVEQAVTGMEGRLAARLDNVARGFSLALDTAGAEIKAHITRHIDARFGETMRKFQEVTDERARVAALEDRIAKLESLLAGRQ